MYRVEPRTVAGSLGAPHTLNTLNTLWCMAGVQGLLSLTLFGLPLCLTRFWRTCFLPCARRTASYRFVFRVPCSPPSPPCSSTCRNKFHAGCLYTWFNNSHNSTCPLCRTAFR
jgi:hypothetical protein